MVIHLLEGLFLLALFREAAVDNTTIEYRVGKWFGIGIVRFENIVCPAADGLDGTCYTRRQCSDISGIASGSCASNIGACCVIQQSCGGTSSYNNTYFINPGFPQPYSGALTCTFIIQKCNDQICQVRIDFLSFTLAQPDGNGNCVYDSLIIVGGATTVPIICGENSGQHVYVDFNGAQDIRIMITTTASIDCPRIWNIKIAQIDCNCPTKAPPGCLMYYTSPSGIVRSFNFGVTVSGLLNGADPPRPGTRELVNLNYGVCIKAVPGYCAIRWSQTSDPYSFTVTNNTIGLSVLSGLPSQGLNGTDCTTDFVVVPNPIGVPADRFCGNQFPTITTAARPFVLTVVTNGDDLPDIGNRGFALSYTELACPPPTY